MMDSVRAAADEEMDNGGSVCVCVGAPGGRAARGRGGEGGVGGGGGGGGGGVILVSMEDARYVATHQWLSHHARLLLVADTA
jgi:hypothetical protein